MGQHMQGMHKDMPMMGGKMREHQERHFKESDTNGDGKLSLEEMQAHAKSRFEKMDANKDGGVTMEEMREHHRAMREKMHEGDGK
jgi:Ca2+-binding EF-hand superfamily protein